MMGNLTLIRGLPGSGKSSLAKKITQRSGNHLEADQYFMKSGTYEFDADRLQHAHAWCLNTTRELLQTGEDVVVSNTFSTWRELRPYVELSRALGVEPVLILMQSQFQNIHAVPDTSLERMRRRFHWNITEFLYPTADATPLQE
jgi:predicted kinase